MKSVTWIFLNYGELYLPSEKEGVMYVQARVYSWYKQQVTTRNFAKP